LYVVFPLLNNFFQGDYFVQKEMHCFKTIAQYEITIVYLKSYCNEFIVMQCINMYSLKLHLKTLFKIQVYLQYHIFLFQ